MRPYRVLFAALATVVMCAFAAPSRASLGTNFTDQWWNPNESGWGASVSQQFNTLFIDLFVYGSDGRPTWYTAAVYLDPQTAGHFTGDLYATTGPWFGTFFNPSAVAARRVGTMTFDASSTDFATLSYTVDGVAVTKQVQRQLWAYEDFTGGYYGGMVYDQSACANPVNNGHVEEFGAFQINHPADNSFSLTLQSSFGNCTISGAYSQLGHMGTVDANYTCTYGISGTMTLYELERTSSGMTGRFLGHNNACTVSGTIGGVQR
jgi:hypothetical protein